MNNPYFGPPPHHTTRLCFLSVVCTGRLILTLLDIVLNLAVLDRLWPTDTLPAHARKAMGLVRGMLPWNNCAKYVMVKAMFTLLVPPDTCLGCKTGIFR